ncbi:putative neuroblastoma breakpoint family member 5 [Mirounga angustirostris]|uniref:putative neuroblastoma breakpoint family member 5 n=1 Tax=Mirounga angustirostris TaxID=9716 RepID=UPI00313D5AD3
MAAPLGPLSDPGAEISLLEINQELQSQLEKSQQDFRDLKEKFLISEATAYFLANQLQKYKCEESTDIIESVLGEKVRFEKGKRADTVAENLSMEQQEVEKKEILQDKVDECVLTPSTLQEGSESDQSYSDGEFPLDEQEFGSALDLACECSHTQGDGTRCGPSENRIDQEGLKGQESAAPRSTAIFLPEELEVCSSLEATSEYSIVQVIKLHLDTHKDLLFFVGLSS